MLQTIFSGLTNTGFPTATSTFPGGDFIVFSTPGLGADEGYEISLVIVAILPVIGERRFHEAIADTQDVIVIPHEIGRRGINMKAIVATSFSIDLEVHVGKYQIDSDASGNEYIQSFTQDDLDEGTILIEHELDNLDPLVQVYDGNSKQTLRGSIIIIDEDTILIDFSSDIETDELIGSYTVRIG